VAILFIIISIGTVFFYQKKSESSNTKINIFFEANTKDDKKMEIINDLQGTIVDEIEATNLIVVNIQGITRKEAEILIKDLEENESVKAATISDDIPVNTD